MPPGNRQKRRVQGRVGLKIKQKYWIPEILGRDTGVYFEDVGCSSVRENTELAVRTSQKSHLHC